VETPAWKTARYWDFRPTEVRLKPAGSQQDRSLRVRVPAYHPLKRVAVACRLKPAMCLRPDRQRQWVVSEVWNTDRRGCVAGTEVGPALSRSGCAAGFSRWWAGGKPALLSAGFQPGFGGANASVPPAEAGGSCLPAEAGNAETSTRERGRRWSFTSTEARPKLMGWTDRAWRTCRHRSLRSLGAGQRPEDKPAACRMCQPQGRRMKDPAGGRVCREAPPRGLEPRSPG
jgi:hypothetical protein